MRHFTRKSGIVGDGIRESGGGRHLDAVFSRSIEGPVSAVLDGSAKPGKERLGALDPLRLGQEGRGGHLEAVHLGCVKHAVSMGAEPPTAVAVLLLLATLVRLTTLGDLPEHDGAGLLAVANPCPYDPGGTVRQVMPCRERAVQASMALSADSPSKRARYNVP